MEGQFWLSGADEMVTGQLGVIPLGRGALGGRGDQSTTGSAEREAAGGCTGRAGSPGPGLEAMLPAQGQLPGARSGSAPMSVSLFVTPISEASSSWRGIGLALTTLL